MVMCATTSSFLTPCHSIWSLCSDLSLLSSPTSCSTPAIALPAKNGLSFLSNPTLGRREHLGNRLHMEASTDSATRLENPAVLVVEAARRARSVRSLLLSSTLIVEDGMEEQVASLCKGIVEWGSERQKDEKSGIIKFECYKDIFEKNVYHFMEYYDSFQSLTNNRDSNEHKKFVIDVRSLLKEPIALVAYEYKDGQIGHALNPIGPKGEGGLDDATGQFSLDEKRKSRKKDGSSDDSDSSMDNSSVLKAAVAEDESKRDTAASEMEKSEGLTLEDLLAGKN